MAPMPSASVSSAPSANAGRLRKLRHSEDRILADGLESDEDVGIARLLPDAHPAAEALERVAARGLRRQAGGDAVLDPRVDVELALLVNLGLRSRCRSTLVSRSIQDMSVP